MPWKIVERKIGRAGGFKERESRQRQWDKKFGEGYWVIGYLVEGEFILQETAITSIYNRSYFEHFENHPNDLEELISLAKEISNPHAVATGGVDLQVPAIKTYLEERNLSLQGKERVDIGTWQGKGSHAISTRLSPLQVKCCLNHKWTIEKFWQEKKCLAIWTDES